jgi:TetR/AcrR family transcriptional repressor of nem operon
MAQGYRDEDIAVLARVITNTSHAETRNLLEQPLNGVSMGRSSKEQADESRRRIVAEAGNLFRSRGYDAVGIAYVMKAAGMTQGRLLQALRLEGGAGRGGVVLGFKLSSVIWQRQDKGASPAAAVVDYYLAPKPAEHRCPMVAHGEEVGRMEEDCALRGVYADGAKALYEIFMDAAKGSMPEDRAKLLFAAMIGVNMLNRAADDARWVATLRKSVKDPTAE